MPKLKPLVLLGLSLSFAALINSASAVTVTVGLDADPPRLDPALSSALVDRQVMNQIFDKLVDLDVNLKVIPALATSWKVTNGGLLYTFKLKSGVKFTDGTVLDAAAVKYGIDRNRTLEGSVRKNELSSVKEVKVVDPQTVQIVLSQPYGPLLAVLTDRAGMIVSPTAAKKEGADFQNNPVGSGPFVFVSRVRQDNITLSANKNYWDGAPKIDKLIYRPFPDGDVRYANLLSGAVQTVTPIDPKDISKLEQNTKFSVMNYPGIGYQGVWFNVTRAPFNNKNFRQAVAATIDREAIAKSIFYGTVTPAAGPFPPGTSAASSAITVQKPNIALAKSKLGGKPLTFTLLTVPGSVTTQLAQVYQAMFAQAGITAKIEQVEFGTLLDRADKKDYDALMLGWSGRPDPDGNIYDFFVTGGSNNQAGYSNKTVDGLLAKARAQNAMSARIATYNVALSTIINDTPYTWVYFQGNQVASVKGLSGLKPIPDGILRFKDVELK
ncbi:peptide ABC transporter substrate-binding protein (plasmid) [Deinococcus psychrotolerans]|uniref:Peptide ABC transporter substrate-binding protein n=1 Tax=Deinococcus psychrotolerans TaxID=2489213 RepID=A0A3G8YUN5_9DEIO|nr:ABC transporter substrate-binding protein [Deinococcus psychrotolerans]AZI44926.1 peptide ABC transporter substrate-binding protein [Deinococcus psychrotolerans]